MHSAFVFHGRCGVKAYLRKLKGVLMWQISVLEQLETLSLVEYFRFTPDPSGPVSSSRLGGFPSGGTGFPPNSPFIPAWDDLPIQSASRTHQASPLSTPWSTCSTRSPPCESLSEQSLYLLSSPGSSDISFGCIWSWSGRPRSLQGG